MPCRHRNSGLVGSWSWCGQGHVHSVEGDDEVLRVEYFGEGVYDARFLTDAPGEVFVVHAVAQTHALLVDDGQVGLGVSGGVVSPEAQAPAFVLEGLEVGPHGLRVVVGAVPGDRALDDGVAVAQDVVAEVVEFLVGLREELVGARGFGGEAAAGRVGRAGRWGRAGQ